MKHGPWMLGLGIVLALGDAAATQAATITFSDSIPLTTTDWTDSVSIPLFDPSQGTLTSILFTLGGGIQGSIALENLDSSPIAVTGTLQAIITLERPDNSDLAVVLPTASTSTVLDPFDGAIDFNGPSGESLTGLASTASTTATSPPPASDLTMFTGVGVVVLPVTAEGNSVATGSGNLATVFLTSASANVDVTYTFTPAGPVAVPEPSTLVSAAVAGVMGLGVAWRRRRRAAA
jgi:PEP-CTERM motif